MGKTQRKMFNFIKDQERINKENKIHFFTSRLAMIKRIAVIHCWQRCRKTSNLINH